MDFYKVAVGTEIAYPLPALEKRFGKGVFRFFTDPHGRQTVWLPQTLIGEFGLFIDRASEAYAGHDMPAENLAPYVDLNHPEWRRVRVS